MSFYTLPGLPSDLLTTESIDSRRIKVEEQSTALIEGRSFRMALEYSFGATPKVIRFTAQTDFVLTLQKLTADSGALAVRSYRSGTHAGVWTAVNTWSNNIITPYESQVLVETGGTFTPGGPATDVLRLKTAGSTAQKTNVGNGLGNRRMLTAGVYTIVMERLPSSNETCEGVYLIEWEEIP